MAKRSVSILSFFQKKIKSADGDPSSSELTFETPNDSSNVLSDLIDFTSHNGDTGISEINKCLNNPDDISNCVPDFILNKDSDIFDVVEANSKNVKRSAKEKFNLFQNNWDPEPTYNFTLCGKRKLRFQYSWFARWKWLVYSKNEKGAFCKLCVIFGCNEGGRGHQQLGQLVITKFDNWKDSTSKFNNHENTQYHKMSVLKADNIINIYKNQKSAVDVQLNNVLKNNLHENRERIKPIIETILLCGRQGLPTRGHQDSGRIVIGEEPLENDGNFRALLRYRASGGDVMLTKHLTEASSNATYLSGKMQNEIINSCGTLIQRQIVSTINKSQCFTILADETADVSGTEQFSICIRYFDTDLSKIREDFLIFVPVTDVTGNGLATVILNTLTSLGLNLNYLRGQGYDGAATMSGCFNGVQAHITEKYPLALYLHCTSHCLNLAVSYACNVKSVRNTIGSIQEIAVFFRTPKDNMFLKKT